MTPKPNFLLSLILPILGCRLVFKAVWDRVRTPDVQSSASTIQTPANRSILCDSQTQEGMLVE